MSITLVPFGRRHVVSMSCRPSPDRRSAECGQFRRRRAQEVVAAAPAPLLSPFFFLPSLFAHSGPSSRWTIATQCELESSETKPATVSGLTGPHLSPEKVCDSVTTPRHVVYLFFELTFDSTAEHSVSDAE